MWRVLLSSCVRRALREAARIIDLFSDAAPTRAPINAAEELRQASAAHADAVVPERVRRSCKK